MAGRAPFDDFLRSAREQSRSSVHQTNELMHASNQPPRGGQGQGSEDLIGMFIRDERIRTEEARENQDSLGESLAMIRQSVDQRQGSQGHTAYNSDRPRSESNLVIPENRLANEALERIYGKANGDQSFTSAQRIDCLVQGVKLELSRMGLRPDEIRKYLKLYMDRLIKEKRWSLSYSEALEEGTLANETTPVENDDGALFYCNFCELKYHPDGIRCKICHVDFLLRLDLEAHVMIDHQIFVEGEFKCPYCQLSFRDDPKMYRDHIYTRHFCSDDHLECPYGCKMLVLKSIPSEKHYRTYHTCHICGDKIGRDSKYHMQRFHSDGGDDVEVVEVKPSKEEIKTSSVSRSQDELIMRAKEVLEGNNMDVLANRRGSELIPRTQEIDRQAIGQHISLDSYRIEADFNLRLQDTRAVGRDFDAGHKSKPDQAVGIQLEKFDFSFETSSWKSCKECGLKTPVAGYVCQLCNEAGFLYKVELNVHIRDAHGYPTPSSELNCEICRSILPSNEELMRHIFKIAHRCSSQHLSCPQDHKCSQLFASNDEVDRHLFEVHGKRPPALTSGKDSNIGVVEEQRDPNYSFELAPRIRDKKSQSILNISKMRNKYLKIPVDYQPEAALEPMISKRRLELVDAGFMHCAKCPLMYHPTLSGCGRCTLKFIFPQAVMEHMVNVHEVPEIYSEKRCPFCREAMMSYTEFLNHVVAHFCAEHSECEFGCSKLVVGGPKDVVKHALDYHGSSPAKPLTDSVKELYKAVTETTEKQKPKSSVPVLSKEEAKLKAKAVEMCLYCGYQPKRKDGPVSCEKCPARNLYSFASKGDLLIHNSAVHSAQSGEKEFCSTCASDVGKRGSTRKFNGDGLNQHRKTVHAFCGREHFRCKQCQVIVPFDRQNEHLIQKHGNKESNGALSKDKFSNLHEVNDDNLAIDEEPKSLNANKRLECVTRGWKHCKFCPYSVSYSIIYSCRVCELSFFAEVDLDFHLYTLHKDESVKVFQCSCGYKTMNVSMWLDHRKEEHGLCAEHIACRNRHCVWLFPNKKELLHHYQMSSCKVENQTISNIATTAKQCSACFGVVAGESFVSCLLCTPLQKNFPTAIDFSSHLTLTHRRFITGSFKCPVCPIVMYDVSLMKKHMTNDHAFCNSGHALCSKRMDCSVLIQDSAVNVITHVCKPLSSAQSTNILTILKSKGSYRCNTCSLGFDKIIIQECPECPITFLSKIELAAHLKIDHNKTFTSAFPCNLCNSSFPCQPESLLIHRMKIHQHCPFHKYEFGRISILNGSVQAKALAEGLRKADIRSYLCQTCKRDIRSFDKLHPPKQCPICPFNPGFFADSEFIVHMQTVHKTLMNVTVDKVKCYQGDCSFVAATALDFCHHRVQEHQMCSTHLVCPMYYCRKIFSSLPAFLKHISSCDGVKPKVLLDGIGQLKSLEGTFEMMVRPFYHYRCDKCPFNIATSLFFKCKLCNDPEQFDSKMPYFTGQTFLLHLIQRHGFEEPKEQYSCQYCIYSTFSATPSELREHMRDKHGICARHFLCGGTCLTMYPRMRKFEAGHREKSNCGKLPLQLFEGSQFSFELVTTTDLLNEKVFKTSQRTLKFISFSGLPTLTDAQGNTTLKSIFTATASMLPSELLEETKQKLKQELVRDKKRQEKKAIGQPKKEEKPDRSRTPSKRRSRTRSRSPVRRRSRTRSRSRSRNRRRRRSRSRSRSRSRRRRRSTRSRSVSRRKRRIRASKSRSISRPRKRSRSSSTPRRRTRRLPSKSRSISKPREEKPEKKETNETKAVSPPKRRRKSISKEKSKSRSRSVSGERKITQNVVDMPAEKLVTEASGKWSDSKSSQPAKTKEVKVAAAGDGVESKSLSTLMNEYSEPHSLSTLAETYSKVPSPGVEGTPIDIEESDHESGKEPENRIEYGDRKQPAQWEDFMSSMLDYTDELMVKNSNSAQSGNDGSEIREDIDGAENENDDAALDEDRLISDYDGEINLESENEENFEQNLPEEQFNETIGDDELLLGDDDLDQEL